jgi:hypothetical protein
LPGRAIDGTSFGGGGGGGNGNGYGAANSFSGGNSYGGLVGLNSGSYMPPQQQQQQQQQYQPPQQQPQPRGGGGGGGNVCRFGRGCHRESCFYVHPNGREIDDAPPGAISAGPGARPVSSSPNADFDEWEQQEEIAAAQEEAAALAAIQNCECCGGRPYECQNAACKDAGRCGCTMGDEDDDNEADDSWSDTHRTPPPRMRVQWRCCIRPSARGDAALC